MIRDFVAGVAWGAVVSTVGLGVISQVSAPPAHVVPAPGDQTQLAEAGPAPDAATGTAPEVTAPVPADPLPDVPVPDVPVPADPVPAAPQTEAPAPATLPQPDASPALTDPALATPALTDPAAPVAPAAPQPAAPAPAAEAAPAVAPQAPAPLPIPDAPPAPTPPVAADAPAAPMPDGAPAITAAPATPDVAANDLAPLPADLPPPAPGTAPDRLLEPGPEAAPPPEPALIAPAPEPTPEPAPSTLTADPGLTESAPGVTVGRLPAIGNAPAPADAPAEPAADLPPILRYAAPFENPAGKPLFALILIDDGSATLDRAQLAALPFPVTFVVDPLAANAAGAAATYRAAGQEVAMLATGIPAGATAADLEQSFQALAAALPEAVALIDLAQGGFQDDRTLAAQVVPIVQAQGRGLLTYDRGLNAADQVARREDVPAAVIFRQLDAQGEAGPVLRRYLDRAAFKAAQEGRVAVIGTARPETIAAILEWTVEGRAASVALAPATAVMTVN